MADGWLKSSTNRQAAWNIEMIIDESVNHCIDLVTWLIPVASRPSARPTNDISIELEIGPNFGVLRVKMYSTDQTV